MKWAEVPVGKPKRGQILINQSHVGLNYIDVYHRSGLYPLEMPHGIGMEAAGTVEAVGAGVNGIRVGDRVAYAAGPPVPTGVPHHAGRPRCETAGLDQQRASRRDDASGHDHGVSHPPDL